jgi:hypothetical protein
MGGAIKSVLSVVTGGLIKDPAVKKAEQAQAAAVAQQAAAVTQQQALLDKQTAKGATSLTRKASLASGAGAQSLLSGSMLGTETKKATLG